MTYRILRNHRENLKSTDTVEACGLSWDEADRQREALSERERALHPQLSSWSRDIFIIQQEGLIELLERGVLPGSEVRP